MKRFRANAVSVGEVRDVNAFCLLLAENHDGSGARLEIQRALTFDEQDRELGQDTYCLGDENGASHYGGVVSWELSTGLLRIHLDDAAKQEMNVDGGYVVEVGPNNEDQLRAGLERTLR